MNRNDNRANDEPRSCRITRNYIKHAEGSVLIEMGDTKVICTATVEDKVPQWMKDNGGGWITAEYGLLPRSTKSRSRRESLSGKVSGRTSEIMRFIGRSLRSVVDLKALGERTILIDCDVVQADGGTRTASITGAFVAMIDAISNLKKHGIVNTRPVLSYLAAISCGIVQSRILLDLDYSEDSQAQVDLNLVMTSGGRLVEIQGTAEGTPYTRQQLLMMMDVAEKGIEKLILQQKEVLADVKGIIQQESA